MLTAKDIKNLIQAFQEVFYSKEEFDEKFAEMKTNFSELQTAVDGIAIIGKGNADEQKILGSKTKRLEDWTIAAARKIKLPYEP